MFSSDRQRRAAFYNMNRFSCGNQFTKKEPWGWDTIHYGEASGKKPEGRTIESTFGTIYPDEGTIIMRERETNPEGQTIYAAEYEEPLKDTYINEPIYRGNPVYESTHDLIPLNKKLKDFRSQNYGDYKFDRSRPKSIEERIYDRYVTMGESYPGNYDSVYELRMRDIDNGEFLPNSYYNINDKKLRRLIHGFD